MYGNCVYRFVQIIHIYPLKRYVYVELAQSKDARKAVIVLMDLASKICCLHGYLKPHLLACTASFFLMLGMYNVYTYYMYICIIRNS